MSVAHTGLLVTISAIKRDASRFDNRISSIVSIMTYNRVKAARRLFPGLGHLLRAMRKPLDSLSAEASINCLRRALL